MRAQFVIMYNGPFNKPKLPKIPGIASYKGHTFHTSRVAFLCSEQSGFITGAEIDIDGGLRLNNNSLT